MTCENPPCYGPPKDVPPKWFKFRNYLRALRFRTRWMIIEYIGHGKKSTEEIYNYLLKKGEKLTKSGLYYHLSELKSAGIIEIAGYIERGGAPEKVWKLKTKKIVIDLLEQKHKVVK
ncbi:MAG: winged helix-turn-helix transcriptional regulator [Thermoplasmata archaeon]|nr:winged helix-turn-helix transcriptional regulator [Thermoplasmata archaeon]